MNLGPPRYCAIFAMVDVDDSFPSDCSSGRFSYQEIFTYLREGKYPEDFEKKRQASSQEKSKVFLL